MLTEDTASVYYQYKEENVGRKEKHDTKETVESKIDALRKNFEMACVAFDTIVNQDLEEGSAKRKLDVVMERLFNIKSVLNERSDTIDLCNRPYIDETVFANLMNTMAHQIDDMKNTILNRIEDGLQNAMDVARENQELKVLLKREKEEVIHQQQSHNFAVTEKNTILATCRKLEEQLEDKNKQILQLQKESTVSLWEKEKTRLLNGIKTNEVDLSQQLKKVQAEATETKERFQRRVMDLTDQIKMLKLEKEVGGRLRSSLTPQSVYSIPNLNDKESSLKQQLYRKERSLVIAEAELQKQQKYFIGFIHGLKRDFIIMLEKEGKKMDDFSTDNRAFLSMLSRIYTASTEGILSELKAKLPVHYQGVNEESLKHPLGKKLTRSISQLNKEYNELQRSGDANDPLLMKPLFTKWRDANINIQTLTSQTHGVHPTMVDIKTGTLIAGEAMKFFPEWTEHDVKDMFEHFKKFDVNKDFHLDCDELLNAIPDILGKMTTTEEIKEAMNEIDLDNSGTVDFFEFLVVAKLVTQQEGKSSIFKKKRLTALQKSPPVNSRVCIIQ
ncbi:uncharacterized protein LOC124446901 [Xenia sp. Carnegie-2017]|uniref:uncharacterized protein LOC124446901 n=1 Tax=Xenia sp. Carnegie-2017 TaxID=2897299 RepID=UPI001F04BD53|nr:uncharacterized protein LOC124446901 [Xenia sp. Carnegie-2017]